MKQDNKQTDEAFLSTLTEISANSMKKRWFVLESYTGFCLLKEVGSTSEQVLLL
jgi:hypothetical protein